MLKVTSARFSTVCKIVAPLLAGAALLSVTQTVFAQSVTVQQGIYSQPRSVNSLIYGSPIPMPMPVDPITGFSVNPNTNYLQQRVNPTIVAPNVINQTNTLINPVIVNDSWQYPRVIRRSRTIYTYPYSP